MITKYIVFFLFYSWNDWEEKKKEKKTKNNKRKKKMQENFFLKQLNWETDFFNFFKNVFFGGVVCLTLQLEKSRLLKKKKKKT